MAKFVSIEVLGDKALQRKLKALPIALERKIVRKALRAAAKPVLATAKAMVPVESGKLQKGLKLRALTKQKRGQFGVQVRTPTRDELGLPYAERYYYPAHLELGHGNVAGRPFLRNALDSNRTTSTAIAAREIRAGIEAEAQRG